MAAHSNWPASSFERVMLCPGSWSLSQGAPRTTSEYAAEGTAAHQVLTWALQEGKPATAYIGRKVEADGYTFVVDDDMALALQVTIDYVRAAAGDTPLLVDQRVNYHGFINVAEGEGWGTLDVAWVVDGELHALDLKFGRGVHVSAGDDTQPAGTSPNPQLALYALGVLQDFEGIIDVDRVRLIISQPRIVDAPSEYDLTVEQLVAWGTGRARSAVASAINAVGATEDLANTFFSPGEKQCKFCPAKATCPALRDEVVETVGAGASDFEDLTVVGPDVLTDSDWLAKCMGKVDLIEDWCKAVRAEVERRLFDSIAVDGWKLVPGKRGARQWADKDQAEELLRKRFRLPIEKAYDLSLISPTTAEKLAKAGELGGRQWKTLQKIVVQTTGKAHVAPATDPRPALQVTPAVDDFEDVTDLA